MLRFEYDREVDALYIYVREIPDGGAVRQLELRDGVYLDADAEGRTLGVEFLALEDFCKWLNENGGQVEIPEHVEVVSSHPA